MDFPSFLQTFFLVSHLLVLHSSGSSCPSSFDCGALRTIKFPFTTITDPQCGLCTLSCQEQGPKVKFGEEERFYPVNGIDDDAIKISDPMLKSLIDSKNCGSFSYVNLLNTGSISYTISPNRTFFKCLTSSPEHENQTDKYFSGNYTHYRGQGCYGYTVYYSYRKDTVLTPGSVPGNCRVFQLPVVSSVEDQNLTDPFPLLTSDFSVEYHVSKECHACLNDGGRCLRDTQEFQCLRGTSISVVIPSKTTSIYSKLLHMN